jgi:hypothetical protein
MRTYHHAVPDHVLPQPTLLGIIGALLIMVEAMLIANVIYKAIFVKKGK